MTGPSTESVRRLLEAAVRAGYAPGLVAGWLGKDQSTPVTVAVGRAVIGPEAVPASPATRFDLASLTKPLVVGTLGLLTMRDGAFQLETTVADLVPETRNHPIGSRTVKQLLTHTSGLSAWAPLYGFSKNGPGGALDAVLDLQVDEAGPHVVYSCPGFILLGLILERTTSRPLDKLLRERVLQPLDLEEELGFRPSNLASLAGGAACPGAERARVLERGLGPSCIPPFSAGMPDDGNARFLGGVAGNAGLFGTITGVLSLAGSLLGEGELLTSEEMALATTNHTPGLEQARGLGWQVASSPGCSAGPALDPSAFGHTGFTGTSLWIDPTRGIAMALLSNRVHPGHRETDLHPLRRRFHQLVIDSLD